MSLEGFAQVQASSRARFAAPSAFVDPVESRKLLPDAPSSAGVPVVDSLTPAVRAVDDLAAAAPVQRETVASRHAKFILPGEVAPQLSAKDKIYMGLIHGISLDSVTVWIFSSGYSQIRNLAPNYGTDTGAYGQRLGASALRGYTEETLGTSVLAPLLHQDPRYYKMGPRRNVVVRTGYAVTRTIVTRGDSGRLELNLWLTGGNLAGSTLTNAYYPNENRNAGQTLRTFGASMEGATLAFFVAEFFPDKLVSRALRHIHLMPQ